MMKNIEILIAVRILLFLSFFYFTSSSQSLVYIGLIQVPQDQVKGAHRARCKLPWPPPMTPQWHLLLLNWPFHHNSSSTPRSSSLYPRVNNVCLRQEAQRWFDLILRIRSRWQQQEQNVMYGLTASLVFCSLVLVMQNMYYIYRCVIQRGCYKLLPVHMSPDVYTMCLVWG